MAAVVIASLLAVVPQVNGDLVVAPPHINCQTVCADRNMICDASEFEQSKLIANAQSPHPIFSLSSCNANRNLFCMDIEVGIPVSLRQKTPPDGTTTCFLPNGLDTCTHVCDPSNRFQDYSSMVVVCPCNAPAVSPPIKHTSAFKPSKKPVNIATCGSVVCPQGRNRKDPSLIGSSVDVCCEAPGAILFQPLTTQAPGAILFQPLATQAPAVGQTCGSISCPQGTTIKHPAHLGHTVADCCEATGFQPTAPGQTCGSILCPQGTTMKHPAHLGHTVAQCCETTAVGQTCGSIFCPQGTTMKHPTPLGHTIADCCEELTQKTCGTFDCAAHGLTQVLNAGLVVGFSVAECCTKVVIDGPATGSMPGGNIFT